MNADEYHAVNRDEKAPNYMHCTFCGKYWGDHETTCPHNPHTDDNLVYLQLREPWTDTP